MDAFETRSVVRSRKVRRCPECRGEIEIGQAYCRIAGRYDGDFYAATMCEPCAAFADRYVASMRQASFLNSDEVAFSFGSIIEEAAEYVGYDLPRKQSLADRRDTVLALFDGFDESERAHIQAERKARRDAQRRQLNIIASSRIIRGMAAASDPACALTPRLTQDGKPMCSPVGGAMQVGSDRDAAVGGR